MRAINNKKRLDMVKVKGNTCDKVLDSVIKKLDLEISAVTEKLDNLMHRRATRLQLNIWKAENLKVIKVKGPYGYTFMPESEYLAREVYNLKVIKVKDRYGYVRKMLESAFLNLKLNYKESDEEFHLTRVT